MLEGTLLGKKGSVSMYNEKNRLLSENYRKVSALMRRKRMERTNGNYPDTQNRVLTVLSMNDGISQKELAYILGIRPQSSGEIVRKLEANGLVTRTADENDGRAHRLHLTDSGKAESVKIANSREQASVFDCLSDEEKDQLSALLNKIIENSPKFEDHHHRQHQHARRKAFMDYFSVDDDEETPNENPRFGGEFKRHGRNFRF